MDKNNKKLNLEHQDKITELMTYGENTLLEWKHKTHTDFVIAYKYDKETQEWASGTYFSYFQDHKRQTIQNAAEREFFMRAVCEIDGGMLDVSKLHYGDLSRAHHEMWTRIRIDYINDFLQENNPELLEALDIDEIKSLASNMTNYINDNTYLIEEISEAESEFLCDYIEKLQTQNQNVSKKLNVDLDKNKVKDSIQPDKPINLGSKDKGAR